MAFSGYLIKLGGSSGTILPLYFMKVEGYKCTPDQRMESEAKRSTTGVLNRTTVSHTATKIEFTTPSMTNKDLDQMMDLIKGAWTNNLERKLELEYYDMELGDYNTGTFYMPDTAFTINRIDSDNNLIYYNEATLKFIEY